MPKYKFEEIAINMTEKRKPVEADKYTYIGLEHLDAGNIHVARWGSEVPLKGEKLVMHAGDVLLGKRNAYLRRAAVAPHDGLFSAHGMVLNPNLKVVDKDFFPFFIFSDYFFDAAIRISVGSLSPTINWRDLAKIEFSIPEMEKQRSIALTLWSINNTIEKYKALDKATENLVKGKFVDMFGDPYKNPMGWPVKSFDEVASIDANMTTDYKKYADYPHIGIDSIEKDTGRLIGYRTVQEDNVISGKYIFGPEHIIYSKIRPVLNKVALPDFEGLCSADAYPILPKKNVCDRVFLAYVMRSEYFLTYVLALSSRSQMPKVNRKQINGFKMPIPPINKQEEFVKFVEMCDKGRSALQQSIDELQAMLRNILEDCFNNNRR